MKKILSFLLACVLMLALGVPALASEAPVVASPRAVSPPTSSTSLPYTASVINLGPAHFTYTKFYFKPSSDTLRFYGSMYATNSGPYSSYRVQFDLIEKETGVRVDTYTTLEFSYQANVGFSNSFRGLVPGRAYYLSIKNITPSSSSTHSVYGSITIAN